MRCVSRLMFAAVLLVGGVTASARAAEVTPLLPKEADQVMHVNFKQMLDSDIIKKYALGQIKQAMQGADVKDKLEALGLDPLKDIDTATMGFWGGASDMNFVGVVKGRFDAKKLFDAAKVEADKNKDKVKILTEKVGEKEVTLVKFENENGKPAFITVADDSTVLVGTDKKLALAAVEAFNSKAKAALSKELTALVLKQDEKASMFYAGVVKGKFKDTPAAMFDGLKNVGIDGEKFKEQIDMMETAAVTVNLGKEITLSAVMGMKDADAAQDFNTTLDKLVDTAKTFLPLLGGQQPKFKTIIGDLTKTLGTKAKDKDVTLKFSLTAKAIAEASGVEEEK
jgi:hypothetical protein